MSAPRSPPPGARANGSTSGSVPGSPTKAGPLSLLRTQTNTPPAETRQRREPPVVLGVCAMDVKARSKAMREILTRLNQIQDGGVEVKIFGDVVILEEGRFEIMHVRCDGRRRNQRRQPPSRQPAFASYIRMELQLTRRHRALAAVRCAHLVFLHRLSAAEGARIHTDPRPHAANQHKFARDAEPSLGSPARVSYP